MTDDFERRIRRDLDAIGAAVPVDGAAPVSAAEADAAGRGPWLVTAAAVLLVVGALAWLLGQRDDASSPLDVANSTTSSASPTTVPLVDHTGAEPDSPAPPADTGSHEIWIANPVVGESGGIVVFAMVGPPGEAVFGTVFSVERWDGAEWRHLGAAMSCSYPRCAADLVEGSDPIIVGTVGMSVGESGVGTAEALHVEGFEPGWYRLGRGVAENDVARGVFRVAVDGEIDGEAPPADVVLDGPGIGVDPIVLSSAGGRALLTRLGPPADEDERRGWGLVVDRWTGDEWTSEFAIDTADWESQATAVLPGLAPGAYRLTDRNDPDLVGRLWVSDSVAGESVCPGIPDLAELLGADAAEFGEPGPGVGGRLFSGPAGPRVEWGDAEGVTITYRHPPAVVVDYAGQRSIVEGPLHFRFGQGPAVPSERVEVRITVPGCSGGAIAVFAVDGGTEAENQALAKRLGEGLVRRWEVASGDPAPVECPAAPSPTPATRVPDVFLWLYCPVGEIEMRLVPADVFVDPFDPVAAVTRSLTEAPEGLLSSVPEELRTAPIEVALADGLLTIDWGWDFEAYPIGAAIDSAHNAERILDQIAANAFQFEEIDAIDLGDLPFDVDRPFIYTREQWEQSQADN